VTIFGHHDGRVNRQSPAFAMQPAPRDDVTRGAAKSQTSPLPRFRIGITLRGIRRWGSEERCDGQL
jgi:hypothetical protein